ncbi:helix-hairpin-helix domain-containing protein [Desulfogranum japonicum]|uniref:helix-hairpin-helix domain-containing protein n=1 Tax=Desulfogranum japonicum TaxID=231447 RepID=UPI000490E8DD|nr:helix-hairpin-helix domain-containing protein [Desulfogranum japonicum]
MNPNKVDRNKVKVLTDLPNVGKATEQDLHILGINTPSDLKGKSAYDLYEELCKETGVRHDPCVLDVFLSLTSFIGGAEPKPWWAFTGERKKHFEDQGKSY